MSGLSSFNVATEPGDVLDQSLLCPICKELMNQPVSMPCGHSACKTCLLEMISKQSIGSRPCTCPLCRARIEGDKLNVNVTVSALIGRIQVRCTNVGCSWVGMHSEKETHMETCPFMVIDCPNGPRGCLVKPERYTLNLHIASCPFEKVPCFHCHIGVERSTLASHEDNCREIPRPCPLQCGEQLPRSHIHLHLGDCPQRVVKCTVKGCHNFYALEEEAEHDKQYQESHQVLLKQEVERLRGIIFDQADETVHKVLKIRKSFRWAVKMSDLADGKDAASPFFNVERSTLRFIWARNSTPQKFMLEQLVPSMPLTISLRIALLKDERVQKVVETPHPTLVDEGGVVSMDVDFGQHPNDQDLEFKITVGIYGHV